jgi:hypothetical protein
MNLEHRYDGIVKDMFTLLQEALYRFLTVRMNPLRNRNSRLGKIKTLFL